MRRSRIISGLAAAILTFSGTGIVGYANVGSAESTALETKSAQNSDDLFDDDALIGLEETDDDLGDIFDDDDYLNDIIEDDEFYDFKVGDYSYLFDDEDSVTIVKYYGSEENVSIPMTTSYDGKMYKITGIEGNAFESNDKIKSVTVPNSVTFIGSYSFFNCSSLTSVTLPSGIESIGDSAFAQSGLTSVKLPESALNIGADVFSGCKSLTAVTLPSKLTAIGSSMFCDCRSLDSISVPSTVKSIGDNAFSGCSSLSSVSLSAGLEEIGSYAFAESGLKSVTVPYTVKELNAAFYGCNYLRSVILLNGLESIGENTFFNCQSLTSITVPDSVKKIGTGAFNGCTSLGVAAGMKNVGDFGAHVFTNTPWLASRQSESPFVIVNGILLDATKTTGSVIVPAEAAVINSFAFENAKSVTSVRFAGKVEAIRAYAFIGCTSLEKITLGESLDRLGKGVFKDCKALESIELPASLRVVRSEAFSDSCISSYTIPDSIEIIDRKGFYNYISDNSDNKTVDFVNKSGKLSKLGMGDRMPNADVIKIGEGITEIDSCFYVGKDVKKVYIPKSVTKIGERAFGYYLTFTNPYVKEDIVYDRFNYYKEFDYSYKYNRDLVIYCYEGTAGEQYAKDNGFKQIGTEDGMLKYSAADGTGKFKYGDADGNDKVDVDDLVLVQKKVAGWKVVGGDGCDLDGNGKYEVDDLVIMQKIVAGWKVEPPKK